MFDIEVRREIERAAKARGLEPAAVLAIAEVESGGRAFALVEGRKEPLIRFEGHYFDRRLTPAQRKVARAKGLSSPKAGAVANPVKQAERWNLVNRAALINSEAAFESCSYGIGQVMGAHWSWLGFRSVTELVNLARSGVEGQTALMLTFIDKSGLTKALKAHDWKAFARGYNGRAFAMNDYDGKMARAYARWSRELPLPPEPKPAEKPVETRKPSPAPETAPKVPEAAPAPSQPARRGVWASILAVFGLSGGAALTQAESNAVAGWIVGGLAVAFIVLIVFLVARRCK